MQGAYQQTFSQTKKRVLILLNEEIDELQMGVMQMREESLLKAVAKRKVVYNLSRRGGVQLIYAQMALAQYYIQKSMWDSAARCLEDSRQIKIFGDTSYLLGVVQIKRKKKQIAQKLLEGCLKQEWIEPSAQHRAASQLQAMTQLQKLYFQSGRREKLTELSYQKIRLTRTVGGGFSQTYFQALAMIDMSAIHEAFGQMQQALEKMDALLEGAGEQPAKQIESLQKKAQILAKMGKRIGSISSLKKAVEIVNRYPGCISTQQEQEILQLYIRANLFS